MANEGYTSLQLGMGSKKRKQLKWQQVGHFEKAGVDLKRVLKEFRVTEDALLPVGTELRASHFTAGQYVDVTGTTIGKGMQGVMKRWGFKGGPASHGSSKFHRGAGSTGMCQDPGKTQKGKKMAGRMGGQLRKVMSAWVYKVRTHSARVSESSTSPLVSSPLVSSSSGCERPRRRAEAERRAARKLFQNRRNDSLKPRNAFSAPWSFNTTVATPLQQPGND